MLSLPTPTITVEVVSQVKVTSISPRRSAGRRAPRRLKSGSRPVPETKVSRELGRSLAEYFRADGNHPFQRNLNGIQIPEGWRQTAEEKMAAAALFLYQSSQGYY